MQRPSGCIVSSSRHAKGGCRKRGGRSMKTSEVNARNILLEVLNDMLWHAESDPFIIAKRGPFASHMVTPMPLFLEANPDAYHEAIGHLQTLIDTLETQANEQEPNGENQNG